MSSDGDLVGLEVGRVVGFTVGRDDGKAEGWKVGRADGDLLGLEVGRVVQKGDEAVETSLAAHVITNKSDKVYKLLY